MKAKMPPYPAAQLLADYLKDMPCLLGVSIESDDEINNGRTYLLVHMRPGNKGPPEGSERIPKEYLGIKVMHTCLIVPGRPVLPGEIK